MTISYRMKQMYFGEEENLQIRINPVSKVVSVQLDRCTE